MDQPIHNRSDAHYAPFFTLTNGSWQRCMSCRRLFLLMPMERHCVDGLVGARPTILDWQSVGFSNALASISCRMGARYLCRSVDRSKPRAYFAGTMVVRWKVFALGKIFARMITYDGLFHTFTYGLTNCRQHLAMLYQPSVLQIALVCHFDWDVLHSSERAFECIPPHLRKLPALILPFSFF